MRKKITGIILTSFIVCLLSGCSRDDGKASVATLETTPKMTQTIPTTTEKRTTRPTTAPTTTEEETTEETTPLTTTRAKKVVKQKVELFKGQGVLDFILSQTGDYGPLTSGNYAYVPGNQFTCLNAAANWYIDHLPCYQKYYCGDIYGNQREASQAALDFFEDCGFEAAKRGISQLMTPELKAPLIAGSEGRLGEWNMGLSTNGEPDGLIKAKGKNDCGGFIEFYSSLVSKGGGFFIKYDVPYDLLPETVGGWSKHPLTCNEDLAEVSYGDILYSGSHYEVFLAYDVKQDRMYHFGWGTTRDSFPSTTKPEIIGNTVTSGPMGQRYMHYYAYYHFDGTAAQKSVSNEEVAEMYNLPKPPATTTTATTAEATSKTVTETTSETTSETIPES